MATKRLSNSDRQALVDARWWKQFERNGWKLYGFSYRHCASFIKERDMIEVTPGHLEMFGIEPQRS